MPKRYFNNRIKSFGYALNGLRFAFKNEANARIHLVAFTIVVILAFSFDVSKYDWIILVILSAMVFITEILNTALEQWVDRLIPERDEKAGLVKDLGAAATLVAALAALAGGLIIFLPYLGVNI